MASEAAAFGPGAPGTVPLSEPAIGGNAWRYVKDCLDSGWVSTAGPYVSRFEESVADYIGVAHAVAVVNGTAACHLALRLAGVQSGDLVLTPSLTFIATANSIAYLGAVPRFIDAEAETLGMDAGALRDFLEQETSRGEDGACIDSDSGRRVAACMPVHVFGHPPRMDEIVEVCRARGIPVVEDATEALGSRYRGRHAGTFGVIAALSFNGNKMITTGGGGMVITADADLAERARHLSTQAKRDPRTYHHDELGYNYRMPSLNAALGLAQMEQLPELLEEKWRIAAAYRANLPAGEDARLVTQPQGAESNYWLNAVRLPSPERARRALSVLNRQGYQARPLWTPCHRQPMFADAADCELPVTDDLWRTCVALPSSVGLTVAQVAQIARIVLDDRG